MKAKNILHQAASPGVILMLLVTGCATPALWKQTAAREWKPNPPDQIILVTDTNQQRAVVVLFRQFATCGNSGDSRAVGWHASHQPGEVVLTKTDFTQLMNSANPYITIPMFFEPPEPQQASSLVSGYTVWNSQEQQLAVHISGLPSGPYTLPTSHQKQQTGLRVGMLPLALTADAALVGAALFVIGAAGYVGP